MEYTAKVRRDLWKICSKIRNVVNKIKFNFLEYYLIYDTKKIGFITINQFKTVLSGPLKTIIDLSDDEIELLVQCFCEPNGNLRYVEFSQMVHESLPTYNNKDNFSEKLSNYTKSDLQFLNSMMKMTNDLKSQNLNLKPYFEDYEKVSGNKGLMTIKQFMDILYSLNIKLSQHELQPIINQFIIYSYMINTNKFLDKLNWIYNQSNNLKETILNDTSKGKINKNEMKNKTKLKNNENVFHSVITNKRHKDNVVSILRNVQKHVLQNRINVGQFFTQFDPYNKGVISKEQFRKCLDMIGISSLHRLYYSESELSLLILMFKDNNLTENVRWKKFEDEINTVFVKKNLEKTPESDIECPPRDVKDMPRKGGQDWESVELHMRNLFDPLIFNIKNYLLQRRILLEPYFRTFDRNNHGHITRSCFRRAMSTAGVKCSDEELRVLEKRFMNVDGFNYLKFLENIVNPYEDSKSIIHKPKIKIETDDLLNIEKICDNLKNISLSSLISKIQTIVKRGRIKIDQFFRVFDQYNHSLISNENFQRGIAIAGIQLNLQELDLLEKKFSSKNYPGYIKYRQFCNIIEEAFTTLRLDKNPTVSPKEYLITYEGLCNNLTDEQRAAIDSALSKLCSKPNIGLDDLFKDYDKFKQGIVPQETFMRVITVCKLNMLISSFEIKCLINGFSKCGYHQAFDYRSFLKAIEYKEKVLAESIKKNS
ncbi:uncharacterized protein LOC126900763 [Daktulosphaira vitifoliae]|uniref:uncharacterized protein LOC126900763 n=1 Tax=Daktulosphaira vitifoliae TaxID=58002 RepID=UPI0021AAC9C4|nr:uncharacterized protein LOC126900763 [Daktulosphaira vitifoliae]